MLDQVRFLWELKRAFRGHLRTLAMTFDVTF